LSLFDRPIVVLLSSPSSSYANRPFSFFFSSRRRHTRSTRDWSSDVCSSDLSLRAPAVSVLLEALGVTKRFGGVEALIEVSFSIRSEERRVGKECRYRWWPER